MKMKKANKKQTDNNLISSSKLNCEWNSKVEDITFSWNGIFICDAFVRKNFTILNDNDNVSFYTLHT
jgi:hypothetical protein